jgi:hypothetical protein
MSPIEISLITFSSISIGILFGMFLRNFLPEEHLNADSKDVIKMGIGVIATIAALVLGLLTASAKGKFDTINSELKQTASKIILLDRAMARYGPETKESRNILRYGVASAIGRIWPAEKNSVAVERVDQQRAGIENLEENIQQLSPQNDKQRMLQSKIFQISSEIEEGRWLLIEQIGQGSFPMPLLILLICWLAVIFLCFSLITVPNKTVIAVLFICALAAASSLFLIMEFDQPYTGLIRISSAPMLTALEHLGQ